MNCVKAIEQIATDLKAMRLAGQITNDQLKVYVERIKPLYERAKTMERAKEFRRARTKLTNRKLSHYRQNCNKKGFSYLYWDPAKPNVVHYVRIKKGKMTLHAQSPREVIKWIKDQRQCLFFNAMKFWKIFGEGELPGCVVDYSVFLYRYTIGGKTPHDVLRGMIIPYRKMDDYLEMTDKLTEEAVPPQMMMVITALWHKGK